MTEPFERLRIARTSAGYGTASEAAEAIGISKGTYIGHENGSRAIRMDAAERYARFFKVRLAWLLTGEEPMRAGGISSDRPETQRIPLEQWDPAAPDPLPTDPDHPYANGTSYESTLPGAMPEIDVRSGAGQGTIGEERVLALATGETVTGHLVVNEWVLPDGFLRHELQASQSKSLIMPVIGDSMAPTLQPGDRLIVDTRQSQFGADGLYVFHDGDGAPRVKRLSKVLFSEPPQIEVISDNPIHPKQVVTLSDVSIFGRVVGRISKM